MSKKFNTVLATREFVLFEVEGKRKVAFDKFTKQLHFTISLEQLAIDSALLKKLGLISMYAEGYEQQVDISENLIDIIFDIRKDPPTREYAIGFMQNYLGAFQGVSLTADSEILICVMCAHPLQEQIHSYVKEKYA